jgi:hypothetical protein
LEHSRHAAIGGRTSHTGAYAHIERKASSPPIAGRHTPPARTDQGAAIGLRPAPRSMDRHSPSGVLESCAAIAACTEDVDSDGLGGLPVMWGRIATAGRGTATVPVRRMRRRHGRPLGRLTASRRTVLFVWGATPNNGAGRVSDPGGYAWQPCSLGCLPTVTVRYSPAWEPESKAPTVRRVRQTVGAGGLLAALVAPHVDKTDTEDFDRWRPLGTQAYLRTGIVLVLCSNGRSKLRRPQPSRVSRKGLQAVAGHRAAAALAAGSQRCHPQTLHDRAMAARADPLDARKAESATAASRASHPVRPRMCSQSES